MTTLALLAVVPACAQPHGHEAPPARGAGAATDDFVKLFTNAREDYNPARSTAELATQSDAVVVGRLEEIREGHVRGESRNDPVRTEHLIYVFKVVEKRKGDVVGDKVYVESAKPTLDPAESFDAAADKNADAVLYLKKAPPLGKRTFPSPRPAPADSPMMNFTTPQGFLLWVGGDVVAPLALNTRPLFPSGDPDRSAIRHWLPAQ